MQDAVAGDGSAIVIGFGLTERASQGKRTNRENIGD
jgi:hypothetical protein